MKYCTFKYRIEYEDGEVTNGWSPYRAPEMHDAALRQFVAQCFQKPKPAKVIAVNDVFKINNAALWLAHVQHTVEYKYLIASKCFPQGIPEGGRLESGSIEL